MPTQDKKKAPSQERPAENAGAQTQPRSRKKGLLMGGGMLGLVAAAYVVSLVALPGDTTAPPFQGPFVVGLSDGDLQVNLNGDGGRRYLVMVLKAKYEGYGESYATARTADPVFMAELKDELIGLARRRTMEDLQDRVGAELFMQEVRQVVEPLLFPVHIGNASSFTRPHEASGLKAGLSIDASTMRGGFKAHVIHVDGPAGTLALDDGPVVEFTGAETDLMLENSAGATIFVDTTELDGEYVGDVNVGTFGRILSILKERFITQ